MLGLLLGLGLLGGGLYYFWPKSMDNVQANREAIGRAQEVLASFQRNNGLILDGTNPGQVRLIQMFQEAWNKAPQLPKLRTDGVWDSQTAQVFKQLTGYSPPVVQIPAATMTAGYGPRG